MHSASNKVQVEGSEIDESDDLLLNDGANIRFELYRFLQSISFQDRIKF